MRAGGGRLGSCGCDAEKKDDEVLHGESIVVQAGLRKKKAEGNVRAGSDERYLSVRSFDINLGSARYSPGMLSLISPVNFKDAFRYVVRGKKCSPLHNRHQCSVFKLDGRTLARSVQASRGIVLRSLVIR